MNIIEIDILTGSMCQKWMSLIDLIEDDTAKKLDEKVVIDGWREIQPKEALDMGFDKLVNCSKPEADVLVLVGDESLVCLNKKDYIAN